MLNPPLGTLVLTVTTCPAVTVAIVCIDIGQPLTSEIRALLNKTQTRLQTQSSLLVITCPFIQPL